MSEYHSAELAKARALLESSPLSRTSLSREYHEHVEERPEGDDHGASYDLSDMSWFPESLSTFVDNDIAKGIVLAEHHWRCHKDHGDEHAVHLMMEYGLRLQDLVGHVEAKLQLDGVALQKKENIEKDLVKVLQHACTIYKQAYDVSLGMRGKILFNWAVILSDLGRLVTNQREKIEYNVASCLKYSGVVSIQEENIQALNNWGLVICDLARFCTENAQKNSTIMQARAKAKLLRLAMSCFRRALCQYASVNDRSVLARCTYNMGSVMYQLGLLEKSDLLIHMSHASQYVALACALDPSSEFFSKAMGSVQQFLPLPFLLHTKVVHVYDESREENGIQQWLTRGLVVSAFHVKTLQINSMEVVDTEMNIQDITSCYICEDPWIPFGYGLHMRLKGSLNSFYIAVDSKEELLLLKDAIRMLQISSVIGLQKLDQTLSLHK